MEEKHNRLPVSLRGNPRRRARSQRGRGHGTARLFPSFGKKYAQAMKRQHEGEKAIRNRLAKEGKGGWLTIGDILGQGTRKGV